MQYVHVNFLGMQGDAREGKGQMQSLLRGLEMLRHLVEADGPVTATEVAKALELHQSTASRMLATLATAGYVRKESYRSYAPDYGLLSIALGARPHFSIMETPRRAMQEAADQVPGMTLSICMLWRQELIYFLRSAEGRQPVLFEGHGYPMHLSAPAMRLIADLPDSEALELLEHSRARFGWARPHPHVPADPHGVIEVARSNVTFDCLIDDGYRDVENYVAAAIPLRPYDGHPVALALHGPRDVASDDKLRLLLHEARREVETSIDAAH
ncbi:hypothetical protein GCM10028799_79550 [Kribbella italica]